MVTKWSAVTTNGHCGAKIFAETDKINVNTLFVRFDRWWLSMLGDSSETNMLLVIFPSQHPIAGYESHSEALKRDREREPGSVKGKYYQHCALIGLYMTGPSLDLNVLSNRWYSIIATVPLWRTEGHCSVERAPLSYAYSFRSFDFFHLEASGGKKCKLLLLMSRGSPFGM